MKMLVPLAMPAFTGCTRLFSASAPSSDGTMSAASKLTQAASEAGMLAPLSWGAVALIAAGIASWFLFSRKRALLMIGTAVGLMVGTLVLLEIVGHMIWPLVVLMSLAGAGGVAWVGIELWKKWRASQ